jgi:hypothetical protein
MYSKKSVHEVHLWHSDNKNSYIWSLRSSGMLRGVGWHSLTYYQPTLREDPNYTTAKAWNIETVLHLWRTREILYKNMWQQNNYETKIKILVQFEKESQTCIWQQIVFSMMMMMMMMMMIIIIIIIIIIIHINLWTLCIKQNLRSATKIILKITYHFIIYLMEVNFTDFIYDVFTLKCDKPETWKKEKKIVRNHLI